MAGIGVEALEPEEHPGKPGRAAERPQGGDDLREGGPLRDPGGREGEAQEARPLRAGRDRAVEVDDHPRRALAGEELHRVQSARPDGLREALQRGSTARRLHGRAA